MAAADDHRARALLTRAFARGGHGAQHEPGAGQPPAVPGLRGGRVGDDFRLAFDAHRAAFDLAQVAGQQLQPVRGVAHEVAFDQHFGDCARLVFGHLQGLEQPLREVEQRGGGDGACGGGHGGHHAA